MEYIKAGETIQNFPKMIFWFFPSGWEDLGEVDYSGNNTYESCPYCHCIVHIGKENNKLFKFCPRCLVAYGKPHP